MLALLLACTDPTAKDTAGVDMPTLAPPAPGEGFQMAMTGSVAPFSEAWLCEVYDLTTTDVSAVNRVEFLENEGMHHMTASTTALSGYRLEPGSYDCNDLYADPRLMEEQVTMFGNQGSGEGVIQLPEGVVAVVPAGIQVIQEVHYVNPTDVEVPLFAYVNAWTIPMEDVVTTIWGGQVRDETIRIPPQSTHTEWTRCVMNEDVDVHFLASHSHAGSSAFTIARFDGVTSEAPFYANDDWHDPRITQYDPPLAVPAGQGFEFACTYDNPTDAEVTYGFAATDQMCNMTLVFTPGSTTAECTIVESSDGTLGR